ncbi:MAG: NADH-quinone oxidoreductase subunit C [Candidatus Asgardarchaeia archaeon]
MVANEIPSKEEKLENVESLLTMLKEKFGDAISETKIVKRRLFVDVATESFREILKFLDESFEICFLHTITAVDTTSEFELLYHIFIGEKKVNLNLRIKISRDSPKVPTITDIMPAANVYEREVHDLFGIVFEGHPHLERLILPEDWPDGVYPLRKDYKMGGKK